MRGFLLISLVVCVLSPVTRSSSGARHARSDALKPLNAAQRDQPPAHTGWNSPHTGRNSPQDASSADLVSRLSSQVQSDADPPHSPATRIEAEDTVPRLEPEAVTASVKTAGVKSHTRPSPPTQQAAREGPPIPLSADRVTTTSTPKPTSVHRVQSRQGAEEKASGPPPSPTRHSTDHSSSVQPLLKGKEGDREAGNVTDTVEGRNDKHDTPSHDAQGDGTATDVFPGLAQRFQNQSKNHGEHRRDRAVYEVPCHCDPGCIQQSRNPSNSKVNILLGKPVVASSQSNSIPPCAVTDGKQKSASNSYTEYWMSASNDYKAWVTIDMQTRATITSVVISGHSNRRDGMRSLSVSMDGVHCGDNYDYGDIRSVVNSYFNTDGITYIGCPAGPVTGRYIHIYKREWITTNDRFFKFNEITASGCPENEFLSAGHCNRCPPMEDCAYACDNHYGCRDVPINVAMKKATSQSSTKWGNSAYAVDGITRVADIARCTSTNPAVDGSSNGWWQVDLGQQYAVYSLGITPRLDCCAENLPSAITTYIDDVGFSATTRPTRVCTPSISIGHPVTGQLITIYCHKQRGQWVALLSFERTKALAFCEVQVFGAKLRYFAVGKSCRYKNVVSDCKPNHECNAGFCKVSLGSDCTEGLHDLCVRGAFCESGVCKMPVLGSCSSTSSCRFGTVCDRGLCKWKVHETCENTQQCVTGAMCDSLRKCKVPIGDACLTAENCVSGAECKVPPGSSSSSKICICRNLNSSNACEPRDGFAGGACPCTTANAACNSNLCTCSTGYKPYSIDLTCRLDVNQVCTSNDGCVSALCDTDNKCKWQTGHRCQQGECQNTHVCEGEYCRTKPGIACSLTEALCITGASCEDRGLGPVCRVNTGKPCDSSDDQCNMAAVCVDTTLNNQTTTLCAARPGQSCDGTNSGLCEPNSVCEQGECKLKLLTSCAGDLSALCKAGTTCDNGTCKVTLHAGCTEDNQCDTNTTCDVVLKKCYLPLGHGCEENPEGCVAGTTCNEKHVCSCTTSGAVNLDTCAPKAKYVGGACTVSGDPDTPDCNPGALCNPIGKCQCSPGFAVERTNFTCGQGAGSMCNATLKCVTGTTCDPNRICKLEVRQRCDGRNLGNCKVGTFCDNGVCRLSMGQDCNGVNRDACGTRSVCDITNTCKLSSSSNCGEDHVCVAGAKCTNNTCTCMNGTSTEKGSLCVADEGIVEGPCTVDCDDPNAECRDSQCKCLAGYTVEAFELTCKLGVGRSCKGKEHDCISGTFCDPTYNNCTIILGEPCLTSSQCQAGAACDLDKNCRMDFGGRCTRYGSDCAFGLVCDYTDKCSFGLGRACNKTEDCSIGAFCQNGTCACKNRQSVGTICEPQQGEVYSACSEVLACTVANSSCVASVCQCKADFTVTQTFTCRSISGSSKSAGSINISIFGGIGLAACIIALAIGFVGFRRYRHKATATTDLHTKGAARMQNLQQLSAEVEQSMASKHAAKGAAQSDMDTANTAEGIPSLGDSPDTAPPQSGGFFSTMLAPTSYATAPPQSEGILTPDFQNTTPLESDGIPSLTPDIQNTAPPQSEGIPSLNPDDPAPTESAGILKTFLK
ncbi:uncharacterized protein [Littorina saxatilis]|uniref:F5/8 type C domain-containing protein n=1 Tax=Littorina saxatilis TaxID=31220 RepID=A0AAN9G3T3_9CAEN